MLAAYRKRPLLAAAAMALVLGTAGTVFAIDIFLEVGGIPGESTDIVYRNQFECDAITFETARDADGVHFEELVASMRGGYASGELLTAHLDGRTIPSVTLRLRSSGATKAPTAFYVVTLTNARLTSYREVDDDDGTALEAGFRFDGIDFNYTPTDPVTGAPGTPVTSGYDLTTGAVR